MKRAILLLSFIISGIWVYAQNQDCDSAISLCNGLTPYTVYSPSGPGNDTSELPANTCLVGGEHYSLWYSLSIQDSGSLAIEISYSDNSQNIHFSLFDITGHTCADIPTGVAPQVRCDFDSYGDPIGMYGSPIFLTDVGAGGPAVISPLGVQKGQTYMLLIDDATDSGAEIYLDFTKSTTTFGDTASPLKPFSNNSDTLVLNTGYGWQNIPLSLPLTLSIDKLIQPIPDSSLFSIDSSGWKINFSASASFYDNGRLYIYFSNENIADTAFDLIVGTNAFIDECGGYNSVADTLHIVVVPPVLHADFFAEQGDSNIISITDYSVLADSVYYILTNTSDNSITYFTSRNPTFVISAGVLYQFCQVALGLNDSSTYCVYLDLNNNQITGPEQNCPYALQVCDSIYFQLKGYRGPGTNPNELPDTTCLRNGKNNAVWYTFATGTAGYLQFSISPLDLTDDYDFALFDITGHTCADIKTGVAPEVRCNYTLNTDLLGYMGDSTGIGYWGYGTSSPASGPAFNSALYVDSTPHVFALLVNNFISGGDGYVLDFRGSTAKIGSDSVLIRFAQQYDTICAGNNTLDIALSVPVMGSSINYSALSLIGPAGLIITNVVPADTFTELTNLIQVQFNDTLPQNSDLQIILQPNAAAFLCGRTSALTDTLHIHTKNDGAETGFSYSISNDTLYIDNQSALTRIYYVLSDEHGDTSRFYTDTTFAVLNGNGYYNLCQYPVDTPTCTQPLCETINYNIPVGDYTYYYSGDTLFVNDESQFGDTVYYYLVDSGVGKTALTPTYYYGPNPVIVLPNSGSYELCQVVMNMVATDTFCRSFTYYEAGISSPSGDNNIALYPNPTTGMVHVTLPDLSGTTYLQVYDVLGSLVTQQETQAGTTSTEIDLSNAAAGTYFLKVMLPNKQQVLKVVKF